MARSMEKKALVKGFEKKTSAESVHQPRQGDILPAGYIYSAADIVYVDGAPVKITIDRMRVADNTGGLQIEAKVYNRVPQEDGSIVDIKKLHEEVKRLNIPCRHTHIHFLLPQPLRISLK